MNRRISGTLMLALTVACARQPQPGAADSPGQAGATMTESMTNRLTESERRDGWRLLFDGATLSGWREYRSQQQPRRWFVRDGVLMKTEPVEDIISTDQFGDFELVFEWRISSGGNAGVFYRATEEYEKVYWSGTEYQLLDDAAHGDGRNRLTAAGANYGLYPAPAGAVKPAGQWNLTRILVRGDHAEHWLNGVKLLEFRFGSPDWEARVKAAKFGEFPNYGRAKRGHIAFQGDHEGTLELRNVRIKEL